VLNAATMISYAHVAFCNALASHLALLPSLTCLPLLACCTELTLASTTTAATTLHKQQAGEPAQSKLAAAAFIKDVEKMSVSLRAAQARNMLDFDELQLALRSLSQITDDTEVFSTEQRATAAKLQRQLEGSRLRQVSANAATTV
jgi:hypothetical protein